MTSESLTEQPRKPLLFVAIGQTIMRGAEHIATAKSGTMAQRIARALNNHKPDRKGK